MLGARKFAGFDKNKGVRGGSELTGVLGYGIIYYLLRKGKKIVLVRSLVKRFGWGLKKMVINS